MTINKQYYKVELHSVSAQIYPPCATVGDVERTGDFVITINKMFWECFDPKNIMIYNSNKK